jgi:hypothetical protein
VRFPHMLLALSCTYSICMPQPEISGSGGAARVGHKGRQPLTTLTIAIGS